MSTTETQALPAGRGPSTRSIDDRLFRRVHGRTFTGTFSNFAVVVSDGVLTGSAKVDSVQVKDPNLEMHLQSPEFLDVERHPELTFESSSIERNGNRVRIDGEITIKGHTQAVEVTGVIADPITDPYGGERFGLTLEAAIRRNEFGVSWNNPLPSGEPSLSDDVTIIAELHLAKQN